MSAAKPRANLVESAADPVEYDLPPVLVGPATFNLWEIEGRAVVTDAPASIVGGVVRAPWRNPFRLTPGKYEGQFTVGGQQVPPGQQRLVVTVRV